MIKVIPILPSIESYEHEVCAICEGECCKRYPGMMHPLDITPNGDVGQMLVDIQGLVDTGKYVISDRDLHESDSCTLVRFLTPRGGTTVLEASMNYGPCVFLSDKGCGLSGRDRPIECRTLVPDPTGERCRGHETYDKYETLRAWIPFQEVLEVISDLHWDEVAKQSMESLL